MWISRITTVVNVKTVKVTLTEVLIRILSLKNIATRSKIVESYMYADILTQSMLIHYKG